MAASYATVEEYREDTGDASSSELRVAAVIEQQSAKLRALARIGEGRVLTEDQKSMARALVTDAARKALVPPSLGGVGEAPGIKQASFSANGFQSSATFANPSGTAYFDGSMLKALKRSLGTSQRAFTAMPAIGGGR